MEAVLDFERGCQDLAIILMGVWGRGGRKWNAGRLPCYRIYRGEWEGGGGVRRGEGEQICPCTKCSHTVKRPNAEFRSTAWMYMDQSLPGLESVSCFWTGLRHAQEWIFPMRMENSIEEPFHKQEFSVDYHSTSWRFPLIPPKNVFFRWCSFP